MRRVLLLLFLISGCAEAPPPVQVTPDSLQGEEVASFALPARSEADRLLEQARNLEADAPIEAGSTYRQVIALRPMDARAWSGLARAQIASGRASQARLSARRAMRYARASNDVFAIQDSESTLGLVLVAEGRDDDAMHALIDSMFGSDGSEMGCAYQGLGELFARIESTRGGPMSTPEEALAAFDQGRPDDVGAVEPGDSPTHATVRALQALFDRNLDSAEASLPTLATGDSGVIRGHLLVARRQHPEARDQLMAALTQLAGHPRETELTHLAWLGLGWAHGNDGLYAESLSWFERLLVERPEHVLGLLGKANALAWMKDGTGSELVLRSILAFDSDNPYALAELAGIQLDRGALDDAEASYRAAMSTTGSRYTCPWEGLGLIYLQRGEYDEAELHLRKAIAINPDIEFRKYNALSRILLERGEMTEARSLLKRSIANYPHDLEAKRLLDGMGQAQ